jgi:hypothetical protein
MMNHHGTTRRLDEMGGHARSTLGTLPYLSLHGTLDISNQEVDVSSCDVHSIANAFRCINLFTDLKMLERCKERD